MTTIVDRAVDYTEEEFLISILARLSNDADSFEIGNAMPIPAAAALLVYKKSKKRPRLSILGSIKHNLIFTGGILEQYDLACKGMLDVQFYGGGQIDGQANINLVGIGGYPVSKTRFSGSFGTTLLFYMGKRTILFVREHSKRVLVSKVDFVSAPGTSPKEVFRRGGPIALVTPKCVMSFDPVESIFTLQSVHLGASVHDVKESTGFDFVCPDKVPLTMGPTAEDLRLMRDYVRREVGEVYPNFSKTAFLSHHIAQD